MVRRAPLSPYALVVNHAGMDLSLSNAVAEYKIIANGVQAWLQQRYPVGQLMIRITGISASMRP